MTSKEEHISNNAFEQSETFFTGGTFNWEKSEAVIWSEMQASIRKGSLSRKRVLNRSASWMIAASLILFLGMGSFMRLYTVTVNTPKGKHQLALLPDGSTVNLNAQSTLKYHPYWWRIQREIDFEGEGFFNVEKGKKFTVLSSKGRTEVLGTSFNIFSRHAIYNVTCLTGKVRVTSNTKEQVILHPNSKAKIKIGGTIEVQSNIETYPEISWKRNIFLFTASPVGEVFAEIERQYGISISTNINEEILYSGNFNKEQHVEEILSYICPALGLKYIHKSDKNYLIIPEDE